LKYILVLIVCRPVIARNRERSMVSAIQSSNIPALAVTPSFFCITIITTIFMIIIIPTQFLSTIEYGCSTDGRMSYRYMIFTVTITPALIESDFPD
jgi:hypothetical protein